MDASVFRKAAQSLPDNWGKGAYAVYSSSGSPKYCVLGHVARALGQENGDFDEILVVGTDYSQMLDRITEEQYPELHIDHVWELNDMPETTESDVIAILEKAAAKVEEIV